MLQVICPQDVLAMYTIYDHPDDEPGHFVVRVWLVGPGGRQESDGAVLASDLEAARAELPPGLTRLGRAASDAPCIVETWI